MPLLCHFASLTPVSFKMAFTKCLRLLFHEDGLMVDEEVKLLSLAPL